MSLRFPSDISYGATGGPTKSVEVITVKSGSEKRNKNWKEPLYRFDVSHGVKTQEQLDELIEFFLDIGDGKLNAFRFKNWSEWEVFKNKSYITRPTNNTLKLFKSYLTSTKRITKVVDGTLNLYANDVLVTSGYDLNIDTGIITLSNPATYPVETTLFTFDCEFDFWVRFDTNEMMPSIDNYNIYSVNQIPLVEVRENI